MRAADITITVVDFESTGAVPGLPDEPWQIGLVRLEQGRLVADSVFTSLLRVGARPFSRHAPGRHEEVRAELTDAPSLASLWPKLRPRLHGHVLAAHQVSTEKRFLRQAFSLHSLGPWVDTLKLARLAYPNLASHTLEDLLPALDLTARAQAVAPGRGPHDALYDAVACAVLLEALLANLRWSDVSVEALVAARPDRFHRRIAARRRTAG